MRMFYVVFEFLQPAQFNYKLDDAKNTSVFDVVVQVFSAVFSSASMVKNFNLKSLVLTGLFK